VLWISSGFTSKHQTRLERPGAYPLVEQIKGAPLEKGVALPANIRLDLKGLPRTNTLALALA
jgi:hypothetical protein